MDSFLWRVARDESCGRMLRATRSMKEGESVLREHAYSNVVLSANRGALCAVCLKAADADISCDDCFKVFFCSEKCRDLLQDVHEKECEALEDVDLVASKTSVDVDLLRLLIRILVTRSLDAKDGKLQTDDEGAVRVSYANVKDLVHVLDGEGGLWVDHVRAGAINENSYSLDALDEKHLVAAVGLFPICGLINHSCQPNCTWSNAGGGVMEVRALRDIEEGEEIVLSYIDIDKERGERRRELHDTKHFDCQSQLEDKLVCPSCQFDVPAVAVATEVRAARATLAKAKQTLHQFKYERVVTQLAGISKGVEVHGQLMPFHSSHGVAIGTARVLSDAHIKLGNLVIAYDLRKQLLKALQLVSWRNHLPLALAHFDYAEALRCMLVNPSTPLPEHLNHDELHQEMRASYRVCSDICAVCLGKPHPLRHRALADLKF
ncbi:hypothetical protein BBJ29_001299 [Phytophthora kernoviae]|uniref:SET domain-containing protein n=1 Tax=Phytophthora kernoviae TaxID=325452 RepID=A0A3F2RZ90_9STRA|nr:hypothetical protein BBP00_00001760 [Phytophthora kernoviae]RLN69663.1 hypothetical protein BBJ29_001299 [Phytophthora kernoviae]